MVGENVMLPKIDLELGKPLKKHKFEIIERLAVYEAHHKKCSYCGTPMLFVHTELDHIIPQSTDKKKLEKYVEQGIIQKDFAINSIINILPSCSGCNKIKSDSMEETVVATYLQKARKKYPQVMQKMQKLKKQHELQKHKATIPFEIEFTDGLTRGQINKECIIELTERHIKLSNNEPYLTLINDTKQSIKIYNIKDYRKAINDKYFAFDTYAIYSQYEFEKIDSILRHLEIAKTPKKCSFSNINFFLNKHNLIHVSIANSCAEPYNNYFGQEDSYYRKQCKSTYSLADNIKNIKIIESNFNFLNIEVDGDYGKVITEHLRGDLLGEGYQEILCSCVEYFTGTTIRLFYMTLLRLNDENGLAVATDTVF